MAESRPLLNCPPHLHGHSAHHYSHDDGYNLLNASMMRNILVIGERFSGKTSLLFSIFREAYMNSEVEKESRPRCEIRKFDWPKTWIGDTSDRSLAITTCEVDLSDDGIQHSASQSSRQCKSTSQHEIEVAVEAVKEVTKGYIHLVLAVFKNGRYSLTSLNIIYSAIQHFSNINKVAFLVISHCDGASNQATLLAEVENELFTQNRKIKEVFTIDRVFHMLNKPSVAIVKKEGEPAIVQYMDNDVQSLECIVKNSQNCICTIVEPSVPREPLCQRLLNQPQLLIWIACIIPVYASWEHSKNCMWAVYRSVHRCYVWLRDYDFHQVWPSNTSRSSDHSA